ncbi:MULTISPECIES: prepilin peptidase [Franconibacter]|jgi:leader peptidase (prepilin peptidase)/N-methyltransferase|uniref:prepilin peptidase n=1 Tax=Franconibacter TaxID=1649295 RepID=UPI001984DB23|nr:MULTISPECIES: A24 family peptidase [Franconibacter]GGD33550.1 type 4 prepilin-like proteins leader peptide-processing enzyme [Franconibacter daqui]
MSTPQQLFFLMREEYTLLFYMQCLLLGAIVGSFLGMVISRGPRLAQADSAVLYHLSFPASHCHHCHHSLSWWENIPVVSWFILHGQCHHCGEPIPRWLPGVEISCGLLFVLMAMVFHHPGDIMAGWLLVSFLIILSVLDWQYLLLPDCFTLPLLWLGLLFNTFSDSVALHDAILGAAAGYGFLWALYWFFRLAMNKEALGYGDFKLLAALGAWLGWQSLPYICLIASCIGLLFAAKERRLNTALPFPFGSYLSFAGLWVFICYHYGG